MFLLVVLFGTAAVAWVAYGRYSQIKEEGLVYLGLFRPNPGEIEFENVVALSTPTTCKTNQAHYTGLPPDVVRDFVEVNGKGAGPVRLSVLEGKVPIVSWEDTKRLHEKSAAEVFQPPQHKLLRLSRVGFNSESTEAIACVEISKGTFGQGVLIYLKKTGEQWSVVERRNIWIS